MALPPKKNATASTATPTSATPSVTDPASTEAALTEPDNVSATPSPSTDDATPQSVQVVETPTAGQYQSFDLNGTGKTDDDLSMPAPISNLSADLPPRPEKDFWPDHGDCHVIWPGEEMTIDGQVDGRGVLVTAKRHYRAELANGSKTRWVYKLLYPKGVDVTDRRLVGRLIGKVLSTEEQAKVATGA